MLCSLCNVWLMSTVWSKTETQKPNSLGRIIAPPPITPLCVCVMSSPAGRRPTARRARAELTIYGHGQAFREPPALPCLRARSGCLLCFIHLETDDNTAKCPTSPVSPLLCGLLCRLAWFTYQCVCVGVCLCGGVHGLSRPASLLAAN